MSDLRTAALRALGALEWYRQEYRDIDGGTRFDWTDSAADDLKAALAKHEESRAWLAERKSQWAKDIKIANQNAMEESERIRKAQEEGRCWVCGQPDPDNSEDTKVDPQAIAKQPSPPPEAQTEAEKIAYCAGWWDGLAKARAS